MATDWNPLLTSAREHALAARDGALSSGARMLPSIHLSDEWQYWNNAYVVQFALPGSTVGFPFKVRNQSVNAFTAAGDQPLVGLIHIAEDYYAARKSEQSGKERVKAAEQALKEALRNGYILYFEGARRG